MITKQSLAIGVAMLIAMQTQSLADTSAAAVDPEPEAEAEQTPQLDTVEVSGKFYNTAAESAMKMDIPVMDTPFSVQSYSEALLDAIEADDLGDVFNYMTGVKRAGLTGLDITFRGFKSSGDDQNSILVDGLPGLSGRFGSPPTVGLESIELVRGSMSVLYGQNQPGGFINLIRKKPQAQRETMVGVKGSSYLGDDLSFGDSNGYRVEFDTTGAFDDEGVVLYRLLGEYGDVDTFRDFGFAETTYVAPSLAWNISDATRLTAQVEYRDSKSSFDQGLVAPNRDVSLVADITTNYSGPQSSREEEGTTASLFLAHTFANQWQWNTSLRRVSYDSFQKEFSHVRIRPDLRTLTRRARVLETARTYENFDSNLQMNLGGERISHKLVAGVTVGRDKTRETRLKFFNSVCPGQFCFDIDIYNPVYESVDYDLIPAFNPATPNLLTNNGNESRNVAFYVSDLISIGERWKLSLGLRSFEDKQELKNLNTPGVAPVEKTSRKSALPMGGLLFQPAENWTIYASYSESYVPADPDDQDINGNNPFIPLVGEQVEFGVKTEDLFDGRVSGSIALFRIEQLNLMNSFTCPLGVCYDQLGKARSDGVEIEADLRPTDSWQLAFGYAYTDARVIASNVPVQVGAQLANSPKHSANVWSNYDFGNGFHLGTGLAYVGDYQGVVPAANNPLLMEMPGYTLVDLALSYEWDKYVLNLKLGNALDETYYESTGLTGDLQITPGVPRNVTLSLRAKF
ncbi:MAG: TonB-dependent receptor [Microbacteriaceae bacterium]|nr:TonB-dependent receptor [Microbacteriaceae bacterium]